MLKLSALHEQLSVTQMQHDREVESAQTAATQLRGENERLMSMVDQLSSQLQAASDKLKGTQVRRDTQFPVGRDPLTHVSAQETVHTLERKLGETTRAWEKLKTEAALRDEEMKAKLQSSTQSYDSILHAVRVTAAPGTITRR